MPRIPADVDREDRILAGFTARQVAVMAATALVLYGGWQATRAFVPTLAYLILAVPLGVTISLLVVVRRDGLSLDRLLIAGVRQRLHPRRRVAAAAPAEEVPEWLAQAADGYEPVDCGGIDLPARSVDEAGVIDLGSDGVAVVAACSSVNFALRTPDEQEALTAAFARYLHSLAAPVQILVRTQRLDLSWQITELRNRAAGLPHPALETAALDHADHLEHLGRHADLLRRQFLLVIREPLQTPSASGRRPSRGQGAAGQPARRAAAARLMRRMSEAGDLLGPAGITVTPLEAGRAAAVLAASTHPDARAPSADLAAADEVITTGPIAETDEEPA